MIARAAHTAAATRARGRFLGSSTSGPRHAPSRAHAELAARGTGAGEGEGGRGGGGGVGGGVCSNSSGTGGMPLRPVVAAAAAAAGHELLGLRHVPSLPGCRGGAAPGAQRAVRRAPAA
jgi:hypothetical protein